jgi:hypothetical protein
MLYLNYSKVKRQPRNFRKVYGDYMLNLINSKEFNFQFFLSGSTQVESLEQGAKCFGGATLQKDGTIVSNVEGNDFIAVNDSKNVISLFVPSTANVNEKTDNTHVLNLLIDFLQPTFKNESISYFNTKGSWFSSELNTTVVENITIIQVEFTSEVTSGIIALFVRLAGYVKKELSQEGVSISINDSLAII